MVSAVGGDEPSHSMSVNRWTDNGWLFALTSSAARRARLRGGPNDSGSPAAAMAATGPRTRNLTDPGAQADTVSSSPQVLLMSILPRWSGDVPLHAVPSAHRPTAPAALGAV